MLKSAKFVEENSSHFGLANAGKLPNSNDSLHDNNRNSQAAEYEMEYQDLGHTQIVMPHILLHKATIQLCVTKE